MTRREKPVETPDVKAPRTVTLETFESVTLSVPLNADLARYGANEYAYHQVATLDDIQSLVAAARARFGCTDAVHVKLAAGKVIASRKSTP